MRACDFALNWCVQVVIDRRSDSIEISSRIRVDLRPLVRSLLSMRRQSREHRTAGDYHRKVVKSRERTAGEITDKNKV